MKLALVSTWPQTQCGIASYSHRLIGAIAQRPQAPEIVIVSEMGGAAPMPGVTIRPTFERRGSYSEQLIPALLGDGPASGLAPYGPRHASGLAPYGPRHASGLAPYGRPDVVHFQHAPDILGMEGELTVTLRALKQAGVRTVVTLHTIFTVASGLLERQFGVRGFHQTLGELCDRVIVHTEGSRDILISHGLSPRQVVTIPHGTDAPITGDAARGREFLGVGPDDEVLLFFGFIHTQKNIHVLLPALARLRDRRPRLKLAIAGKPGGNAWYNKLYLRYLQRRAAALGLADRVVFQARFIPDAVVPDIHAAAGAVALPYIQGYASASGVVHGAMAMDVPLLCSKGPKFEEVERHISPDLLVPPHDAAAWADAIARLYGDAAFRADVQTRMRAFADATRWPVVAQAHLDAYGR